MLVWKKTKTELEIEELESKGIEVIGVNSEGRIFVKKENITQEIKDNLPEYYFKEKSIIEAEKLANVEPVIKK